MDTLGSLAYAGVFAFDQFFTAQVSPTGDSQDRFQQFVYDGAGREVFQIDSMWGVTQLRYDGRGNVIGRVSYATPISANALSSSFS